MKTVYVLERKISKYKICEDCYGQGIWKESPCSFCGGTGKRLITEDVFTKSTYLPDEEIK